MLLARLLSVQAWHKASDVRLLLKGTACVTVQLDVTQSRPFEDSFTDRSVCMSLVQASRTSVGAATTCKPPMLALL